MKVYMLVLNNCVRDSRVLKEARTLVSNGYDVTILAILDEDSTPHEYRDGFGITRVSLGRLYRLAKSIIGHVHSSYAASGKTATQNRGIASSLYGAFQLILNLIGRPFVIMQYSRAAWGIVKQTPANIYHSHDLDTLPIAYMVSHHTKGKLVYDAHELYTELRYVPKVERLIFRLLERVLIHKLDAMITTNEPVAQLYSQRYGISKPTVLMNCPMYEVQDNFNHKNGLRAALGTPSDQPIIIYSGGLQQDRGLEQMIAAMSLVNRGILVFLGWGKLEQLLNNLVVERDLVDRVFFVPPVGTNEVSGYIRSADVGIICTQNISLNNYYTSPNKLFEYISAGLPIVASDFPFLRQIIEGYQIGKVCDPTSPQDISRSLDWVLSDKQRYQILKANTQKAAAVINWQNEAKKLVGVYERL